MAAEGVVNKQNKGGYVIAKFNASGGIKLNALDTATGIPIWGANSVGETVTRLNIISAEWSIGNNAYWTVKRGANTVLVLTDGQHVFDLSDSRLIDNGTKEATSNVSVIKTGLGPSTLILKLHKTVTIVGGSEY
jgi:hypothetical protein